MDVAIAISAANGDTRTLALRLIERTLRSLDYPVTADGAVSDPTDAQMADLVADARAAGIRFTLVAC